MKETLVTELPLERFNQKDIIEDAIESKHRNSRHFCCFLTKNETVRVAESFNCILIYKRVEILSYIEFE